MLSLLKYFLESWNRKNLHQFPSKKGIKELNPLKKRSQTPRIYVGRTGVKIQVESIFSSDLFLAIYLMSSYNVSTVDINTTNYTKNQSI